MLKKSLAKKHSYFHKQANNKYMYKILDNFAHIIIVTMLFFISFNVLPVKSFLQPVQAKQNKGSQQIIPAKYNFYVNSPEQEYFNTIDEVHDRNIKRLLAKGNIINMTVTAYNSEVAQCDSTPCITADGFNVCEHNQEDVIATNILPFGTKVMFPELFGDKVFTVHDRMNAKYTYRADIWMRERADAIQFGANYNIKMVVLK